MPKSKKKIISIGGGWVVNNRHIPALKKSGLFEVIGVISKDPKRATSTQTKHDIPHSATEINFDDGWQKEAEAVMIGTWPDAHYDVAKRSLEAGKHVLLEKPMTVEPEHAEELVQLAREKNLVLAMVHNLQYSIASSKLQRDLGSGKIGDVTAVYGVQVSNHARKIPAWCHELPLGLFYDEAPHFAYLFRSIEPNLTLKHASVIEDGQHGKTPTQLTAHYMSDRDVPFFLHVNFDSSITEWHLSVFGKNGVAHLDMWRDIYHFLPNDGQHGPLDIFGKSLRGMAQQLAGLWANGWRYVTGNYLCGNNIVVQRFYEAIDEGRELGTLSGDEGQAVIKMLHDTMNKAVYTPPRQSD